MSYQCVIKEFCHFGSIGYLLAFKVGASFSACYNSLCNNLIAFILNGLQRNL